MSLRSKEETQNRRTGEKMYSGAKTVQGTKQRKGDDSLGPAPLICFLRLFKVRRTSDLTLKPGEEVQSAVTERRCGPLSLL